MRGKQQEFGGQARPEGWQANFVCRRRFGYRPAVRVLDLGSEHLKTKPEPSDVGHPRIVLLISRTQPEQKISEVQEQRKQKRAE